MPIGPIPVDRYMNRYWFGKFNALRHGTYDEGVGAPLHEVVPNDWKLAPRENWDMIKRTWDGRVHDREWRMP